MIYSCTSHIGKVRKNNEDYCKGEVIQIGDKSIGIFALADGMGGHNKGEIASELAVENIIELMKSDLLQNHSIKIDYIDDIIKQAYNDVNLIIYEKSINNKEFEGMGTTLVIAIVYDNKLYVANVGDSRCYILRDNNLEKITTDHSVVEELIQASIITEEEAKTHPRRNQITRAMGTDDMVIVDIFKHSIKGEEKILLASDGLTGCVDKDKIKEILSKKDNVKNLSKELIDVANDMSGRDNITVILIENQ